MSIVENESRIIVPNINNSHLCLNSINGEGSSNTQRSLEIVEVNLVPNVNVHLDMVERNCRICYLTSDSGSDTPIELGCSCQNDLAIAHRHCAETWFKTKGNITCEICGSIARNVTGVVEVQMSEQLNGTNNNASMVPSTGATVPAEVQHCWQSRRFSNFLCMSMLFAFVTIWIFHLYFSL